MKNHEYYLKVVTGAIEELEMKWAEFFKGTLILLTDCPAAVRHHHNFKGGLIRHMAEMLEFGLPHCEPSKIDRLAFIRAVLLHDFAKIKTYTIDKAGSIKYEALAYPVEFWTLNTLAEQGLSLSDEEINALVMAEGGWSEYEKVESGRLASLLHICDLWSAKIIKPQMMVSCPECGAEMAIRKGPRGEFYGCTRYPNCRGIIELGAAVLKPKEHMSEEWFNN